jgi:alkylhydroperoxidase family enzyme
MDLARLAGAPAAAMVQVQERIDLDPGLRELVRLRAESDVPLAQVAAWEESPFFDERERAALALTDAVAHVSTTPVPDAVWVEADAHFSPEELSQLLFAIAEINLWNRLAVTTGECPRG